MQFRQVNIGGIEVALIQKQDDLIQFMLAQLHNDKCVSAMSVNPEIVISAMESAAVRDAVNSSTIRYADGIGVVKAIKHKIGVSVPRLPGCEVWEKLMEEAGNMHIPVYLVGAQEQVVSQTKDDLSNKYNTPIVGYVNGYFTDDSAIIQDIKQSNAKIVTVALGCPKQEKFIAKCREAGIDAIFMGVGGTYDAFTGTLKRAPKVWQSLGLEWLYRLLCQPSRIVRQMSLIKFAYKLLMKKL